MGFKNVITQVSSPARSKQPPTPKPPLEKAPSYPKIIIAPRSSAGGGAATLISEVTGPSPSPPVAPPRLLQRLQQNNLNAKKRVNVTVTILSIAGLCVKDKEAKKKGLMSKTFSRSNSKADESSDAEGENSSTQDKSTASAAPSTSVVASFSRNVTNKEGKARTVMTHVPSLPLPLPSTAGGSKNASSSSSLNSVIHWPEQPDDATFDNTTMKGAGGRVLSAYQFTRTFQREIMTSNSEPTNISSERFVPQPLPIQIAISRSGRMFKLGTAHILLSGEENGESSINVPIKNANSASTPNKSSSSKNKFMNKVAMMKLKGDTLKCGLDPNATLRVLVHVSDPIEPIGETLRIGPNLTVTMISKSFREGRKKSQQARQNQMMQQSESAKRQMQQNLLLQKQQDEKEHDISIPFLASPILLNGIKPSNGSVGTPNMNRTGAQRQNSDDSGPYPSEISWEYNPSLSAVVVKSPSPERKSNNRNKENASESDESSELVPLVRVRTLAEDTLGSDDEDDEEEEVTAASFYQTDDEDRSCTSSAYMTYEKEEHIGLNKCYPTKMTRTYSTATTNSTKSSSLNSMMSDLTDQHSWLSQTGVEVIPFAPTACSGANLKVAKPQLPPNSRLRCLEEDTYVSTAVDTHSTGLTLIEEDKEEEEQNSQHTFLHPVASKLHCSPKLSKNKSWRQRLACGIPSVCGSSYASAEGEGDGDYDYEEDVVSQSYSYIGRCEAMEIQPSLYTDGSSSDDDSEDDDDDDSDASSELM